MGSNEVRGSTALTSGQRRASVSQLPERCNEGVTKGDADPICLLAGT